MKHQSQCRLPYLIQVSSQVFVMTQRKLKILFIQAWKHSRCLLVWRWGLCLALIALSQRVEMRLSSPGRSTDPVMRGLLRLGREGISLDKVGVIKAHLVPVWLCSPEWPCLWESQLMIFMCWEHCGLSTERGSRGKWITRWCAALGYDHYSRHSTSSVA